MRAKLIAFAMIFPTIASASSFKSFDVPGYPETCGNAIASNGVVAGEAQDPDVFRAKVPFIYINGLFSLPPKYRNQNYIPGFLSINRNGDLIGTTLSEAAEYEYFADRKRGGAYCPLSLQAAQLCQGLWSIADDSTVLGLGQLNGNPSPFQPYLWYASGKIEVLPLGTDDYHVIIPSMSSQANWVVGGCGDLKCTYHNGVSATISVADATIYPTAVDNEGRVSGNITINHMGYGLYRLQGKNYTLWNAPDSKWTLINGANEAGQITGCYADKKDAIHGYVATP